MAKGIRKTKEDRINLEKDADFLNEVEAKILSDKASIKSSIAILDSLKTRHSADTDTMTDIATIESSLDFVNQAKL